MKNTTDNNILHWNTVNLGGITNLKSYYFRCASNPHKLRASLSVQPQDGSVTYHIADMEPNDCGIFTFLLEINDRVYSIFSDDDIKIQTDNRIIRKNTNQE